jgi:hypothetical protein
MTKLADKLNDIIFDLEERYSNSHSFVILDKVNIFLQIIEVLVNCDIIYITEANQITERIQSLVDVIKGDNK